MKEWTKPAVEEIKVSQTQYGGKIGIEFDDIYVNSEGNWEGTFSEDPS